MKSSAVKIFLIVWACTALGASCTRQQSRTRADELTIAWPSAPLSDPVRCTDRPSAALLSQIYETLYTYKRGVRPYRVVPLLASSMPVQKGNKVIIKIKKGVRFHSTGAELDASHVVRTLARLTSVKEAGPGAWIFFNRVDGVKRLSKYKVEISLKRKVPELVHLLSLVQTSITGTGAEPVENLPEGTGPYVLKSFDPGRKAELVGYENYRNGSLPKTAHIKIKFIRDPMSSWMLFLKGSIDVMPLTFSLARSVLDERGNLRTVYKRAGVKLYRADGLELTFLAFNFKDPVVGGGRCVREAVCSAIDKEKAVDVLYGGLGKPAYKLFPESLADGAESAEFDYSSSTVDQCEALKESKGLLLTGLSGSAGMTAADFIEMSLAKLKIKTVKKLYSFGEFLKRLEHGDFQIALLGWYADYPDPLNFLNMFTSSSFPPGPNYGRFADPKYDELFSQALLSEEGKKRKKLIREMTDILRRNVVLCPVAHRMTAVLSRDWVEGYSAGERSAGYLGFLKINSKKRSHRKEGDKLPWMF